MGELLVFEMPAFGPRRLANLLPLAGDRDPVPGLLDRPFGQYPGQAHTRDGSLQKIRKAIWQVAGQLQNRRRIRPGVPSVVYRRRLPRHRTVHFPDDRYVRECA